MSEQKIQTTTIIRDGNTIIIAQPHPKPETNFWDTLTALFKSESTTTQPIKQQSAINASFESPKADLAAVSSQPISLQYVLQTKPTEPLISEEDSNQFKKFFTPKNLASYRKSFNDQLQSLDEIDLRLSRDITKFKQENLLTLGDIRIRSILMAFSSALMYKLISVNTEGFLRRSRNLGISFVFMGYWFVPELFNPFLRKPRIAQKIV